MQYRPEIDGLRAVAVVPVILFHAGFSAFGGGFVGVDVFFVISGYLITTIIDDSIRAGTFTVAHFYERRARRILPALFLVCGATLIAGWAWMMPIELRALGQSLVAVNFFVSNVLFFLQSGYFDAASELKPLLHTWSLAVEEQFYLFFPLLVLLLGRFKRSYLVATIAFISLLSFVAAEYASRFNPSAAFYLLPARIWELGAGALIALTASYWAGKRRTLDQTAAIAGVVLIGVAVFFLDGTVPFPGVWALLPVLGTCLIIIFAHPATLVGWILSQKPIVGIGLISYSAYLWHQPLFAFARIRFAAESSVPLVLVLIGGAFALAYFSWRWVERPFRNGFPANRGGVFAGALLVAVVFTVAGAALWQTGGAPQRLTGKASEMAQWAHDKPDAFATCESSDRHYVLPVDACRFGLAGNANSVLIGDSHATALVEALGDELSRFGRGVRLMSFEGCAPSLGIRRLDGDSQRCGEFHRDVVEAVEADASIDTVFLLARWTLYNESTRFNNMEGGIEWGRPVRWGVDAALAQPGSSAVFEDAVNRYMAELSAAGKRIVLLYPVPEAGADVPIQLARELHYGVDRQRPFSTSMEVFDQRNERTVAALDDLTSQYGLLAIHPGKVFCDSFVKNRCVAQLNGDPLYFDDDHLNSVGSAMLAEHIVRVLFEQGVVGRP
ncbi:MAG: acyltransferase [Rhodobiaceae bacterium]|nr:acyltransferase [Rhodobiaceae bacterium]